MLRFLAGVLALVAVAAAQTSVVGEGGGGAAAGASTELQYRNGGAFGAVSFSAWDNTYLTLPNFVIGAMRCTASSGVMTCIDPTATTGITQFVIQGGAGQGSGNDVLTLKNAAGSDFVKFSSGNIFFDATVNFASTSGSAERVAIGSGVYIASSFPIRWSASSDASGTGDVGLERLAAGVLEVTNGSTGVGGLAAGDLTVYDNTATTGVTTAVVKAGAGQSTTDLTQWQDNAGAVLGRITSDGYGKLPAVQLVDPGAKPSCTSDTRGMVWYDAGGAGVADTAEICGKDAADVYAWVAIATF